MTVFEGPGTAVPPGLQALMSRAGRNGRKLPPVEQWNPPFCGELDIRIARDGTWSYMGSPIGRRPLVELFASVLRRDEDGRYFLVTPVEKIGISVEDAPFLAVEMSCDGAGRDQVITLRTNLGDLVKVGKDHPLRFETEAQTGGLKPYVRVRGRLDALFTRALMYQLVDRLDGPADGDGERTGVWSCGQFFAVDDVFSSGPVSE